MELMRLMDKQYLRTPFYGWPRMTAYLRRLGHPVNEKRVRRLMHLMGLCAIYPKPRLSMPSPYHRVYPYLLRDVVPCRTNEVWSADITYVPMRHGFMYLVAILDWFSRYVISFRLSNTADSQLCRQTLDDGLLLGVPEIFNTDQGREVYGPPVHRSPGRARHSDQHGRAGKSL